MVTEAVRPASEQNIVATLPVRYYEYDGAGVVYDDQFYLYNEYGEHMPERMSHSNLNRYIYEILSWLFRNQMVAIYQFLEYRFDYKLSELQVQVQQASFPEDSPQAKMTVKRAKLEPDLALFMKQPTNTDVASFSVGEGKQLPPPDWLLETASPGTYKRDLEIKFELYQDALKAKEYVIFDPHEEQLWKGSRLKGWQLENGLYVPLKQDETGRAWSEVLQSWLVVEDRTLRLYDEQGNLRLTKSEYLENSLEVERAEKERERAEKEAAQRRVAELEARLRALEAGENK